MITQGELHQLTDEIAAEMIADMDDFETPPIATALVHAKISAHFALKSGEREFLHELYQRIASYFANDGAH